MATLNVIKRDGSLEPLNIEKIHKVVIWATEGLSGVSASEVEIKSKIQFYDRIKTSDIHETLIVAAAQLISEDTPNYQYVAGRLINYAIRKEVYGDYRPCPLYELIERNVEAGFYDPALLLDYSYDEWQQIEAFVDHDRDNTLTYAGMEQLRGKYLVQNRVTKQIMESPQVAYVLIAAVLHGQEDRETRLRQVKDYYDGISEYDISLPTPVMAGVRTPVRQFSSCVLIETDDSLESINATSAAIVDYVSQKAGIGIGAGRIRALGSKIRRGDASHTGVTAFYRLFQTATRSCSQGGVRNGAATLYYPIWHLEIEDLLVLKNNKGTEENRIRQMDYGVQFCKLFYERLISGGDITLFSPSDVPEMYEAFFNDQAKFKKLYETAERNTRIRKKRVKALDLFTSFMQERKDTGRIYLQNVDNANTHSSFDEAVAPIRQSNLCAEIGLPTVPMASTKPVRATVRLNEIDSTVAAWRHDGTKLRSITPRVVVSDRTEGEDCTHVEETVLELEGDAEASRIALCTLSAINWGKIDKPEDFARPCRLAVRGLDALLDYQNYPVVAARLATMEHRPIGVGIINLAYWLAKNGLKYSDGSALAKLDEYAEAWSYYLIRASVDLAMEKGPCGRPQDTKYAKGIMPIDTRKPEVDGLVPHVERMPWAQLREDAKTYGIRNATLMALMPAETSAQLSNATNGIEPPRAYVSIKQSKHGVLAQVVPEFRKLRHKYELLWDQKSPIGYLNICAVLQKYIDQAISVNTSYNPRFYPGEEIPMSELLKHLLHFYKMGGKNLYYNNTMDGAGEIDVSKMAETVLAETTSDQSEDAECDSCVL